MKTRKWKSAKDTFEENRMKTEDERILKLHNLARRTLDYIVSDELIQGTGISVKAVLFLALSELDSPTRYSNSEGLR